VYCKFLFTGGGGGGGQLLALPPVSHGQRPALVVPLNCQSFKLVYLFSFYPCIQLDIRSDRSVEVRIFSHVCAAALTSRTKRVLTFYCTGRFIMFSVITDIYNKKTKGPTLMELFTATGKLIFLTTRNVRCVHNGGHGFPVAVDNFIKLGPLVFFL
jgi:hypothetical protein